MSAAIFIQPVHWLDDDDRPACIRHTPIPGIPWTRKIALMTCDACYAKLYGKPRLKIEKPSQQAQAFIDSILKTTGYESV